MMEVLVEQFLWVLKKLPFHFIFLNKQSFFSFLDVLHKEYTLSYVSKYN